MKVHQLARAFWDHRQCETSLTLGCKRLRPLAPKLPGGCGDEPIASSFDLKSFIRPDSAPQKLLPPNPLRDKKHPSPGQVESHPGGTRWNPTQEQIGMLEMLYRGGMRTPNAQQIEQIAAQLGKYGKIEGKNVFYWFQNHKARERQRQKRNILALTTHTTPSNPLLAAPALTLNLDIRGEVGGEEQSLFKRKCRSWTFEGGEDNNSLDNYKEEGDDHKTLELFPLHPEGR
ncbi:hypothetical protein Nepgr_018488 [Nepenthes gracilis]|uniref:Homeobox domain-containing protein n=1 Tax=Nepenthes gracilis TaxID=150966 RepID=A0AAD3XT47_NEPGR|nr:hypothetical protein Nepgr_018488 [Nepenthes gracilis]